MTLTNLPSTNQTEPTFTAVLMGILADYVETHAGPDGKPNITHLEENRILWQSGKLSMSITINDVSREYCP